jgi:hypothetical protein
VLENWLNWKAEELKIRAGALIQRAIDHERKAADYRDLEVSGWNNASKVTGRSYQVEMNYAVEMGNIARAEELAATKLREQAQDATLASQYYVKLGSDAAVVRALAAQARTYGRSFREVVEDRLVPVLKRAERERRTTQ